MAGCLVPAVTSDLVQGRMAAIELGTYLNKKAARFHDCVEACVACLVACEMCWDSCLDEKNVKMMASCIRLDRDCADTCAAAVRAMARGGPLAPEMCRVCALAWDMCAKECERHAAHSDHRRICAEACRPCAEACRTRAA